MTCPAFLLGQTESGNAGGFQINLPTVPTVDARPGDGPQAGDRFTRMRPADDNEPLPRIAQPLQGNDAAIELIVGQGRLLTLKAPIVGEGRDAMIAVGDPSIIDFEVLPNPQMIRLLGRRAGITDISVTTSGGKTYGFEVHVNYDLALLRAQLRQLFPDAMIKLSQIREHLVVEGQARSARQVQQIITTLNAYLESTRGSGRQSQGGSTQGGGNANGSGRGANAGNSPADAGDDTSGDPAEANFGEDPNNPNSPSDSVTTEFAPQARAGGGSSTSRPQVVNLLTVPGSQQVLLNVRIAELNRTAARQIGADMLAQWGPGNVLNTRIAGSSTAAGAAGLLGLTPSAATTAWAIFPTGSFDIALAALRQNSVITILAEPNLIAFSGQQASFLAGGEFPVPVPQASGAGVTSIGLQFKEFGVKLNFTPHVLSEDSIRLRVAPEASTIDQNIGTVIAGTAVPGVNTRRVDTTVEMGQGQTLVLAGLLSVSMDAQTLRIPGFGDLPYIGPLFSNTTHRRVEKELLVLVTPYLVRPMEADQIPLVPGAEITDPNDLEFYFLNRIEGRTGKPFRPTTAWDDPWGFRHMLKFESQNMAGPVGFHDFEPLPAADVPQTSRGGILTERSSRR
ncbi:MAG: pilus assembly protein N-terminal domain-containing protein [Pirellulales bacterium]